MPILYIDGQKAAVCGKVDEIVGNQTKDLNDSNAITLYRYVRRHFTFGEPRHLVEVLDKESGSNLGLHSLLTSMLMNLEGNRVFLLLYESYGVNKSSTIILFKDSIHYFDLTIYDENISFETAIEFLQIGEKYHGPDYQIRYALGENGYKTKFNNNIEFYIWLNKAFGMVN